MYERELQQLGLSEKEARVYLAALELGSATAQEIAQKAGLRRPTTYVIIEGLIKHGFLSWHERGKKRFVSAEFPEVLMHLFVEQEEELKRKKTYAEKLLPELKRIFEHAKEHPKVRFFEGKEGLKAIQEDFLRTARLEAYEIFPLEGIVNVFSEQERKIQLEKRVARKIRMRSICAVSDPTRALSEKLVNLRYIDAQKFPIGIDLLIYEEKVAIASLRGKLIGVIVESKEIADTFRIIFELAWLGAEREPSR